MNTTLGEYFKNLRTDKGLTLDQVSISSGMNKTTIWKIEGGRPVKADTLRTICCTGLKLDEDSKEYTRIVALWIHEQGLTDEPKENISKNLISLSKEKSKSTKSPIAEILESCSLDELTWLKNALSNPASKGAIIALAKHFSDK